MTPRILIVDSEPSFRLLAGAALRAEGFEVREAPFGPEALQQFKQASPDVVLLEHRAQSAEGLELLARFQREVPASETAPEVIMAAGSAEVGGAVEALRAGASDYLAKALGPEVLLLSVQRALEARRLRRTVTALCGQLDARVDQGIRSATSEAMCRVVELVERVAASPATAVLIEGESGSGKASLSRLLHHRTPGRSMRACARLCCAHLSEELIDRELSGFVRGAFTGAERDQPGLLEAADGGTLVLEGIAELAPGAQGRLLQVLESGAFRRLGSPVQRRVDVRVVATTHRNLAEEVQAGRFRLDLFHRLDVFRIQVPPLRARREDILPLTKHFARKLCARLGRPALAFSPEAQATLLAYPFPGNVRELRNATERAVLLERSERITPEALQLGAGPAGRPGSGWAAEIVARAQLSSGRPPSLEELERDYLLRMLEYAGGNRSEVARLMEVSYPTVAKWIADFGIDLSRWRRT